MREIKQFQEQERPKADLFGQVAWEGLSEEVTPEPRRLQQLKETDVPGTECCRWRQDPPHDIGDLGRNEHVGLGCKLMKHFKMATAEP